MREAELHAVPAWIDVGHCWQLASCPLGQDQSPLDSHTQAVHPFCTATSPGVEHAPPLVGDDNDNDDDDEQQTIRATSARSPASLPHLVRSEGMRLRVSERSARDQDAVLRRHRRRRVICKPSSPRARWGSRWSHVPGSTSKGRPGRSRHAPLRARLTESPRGSSRCCTRSTGRRARGDSTTRCTRSTTSRSWASRTARGSRA